MRGLPDLLEVLLFEYEKMITEEKRFLGLCSLNRILYRNNIFTYEELISVSHYIYDYGQEINKCVVYHFWPEHDTESRINFLKSSINKLKEENEK